TRLGRERVSTDDGETVGRKIPYGENSPVGSGRMDTEPRNENHGKPHKQYPHGQPRGESGMGYCPGEYRPHDEAGSPDLQQWREERHGHAYGGYSPADTEGVRSDKDEKVGMGEAFRGGGIR